MTEQQSIVRLAEDRATAYAPRPKLQPALAGILAGIAAYLIVIVFATVAGLRTSNFGMAHLVTVAISFGAAYAYAWHLERAHSKAVMEEIRRLEAQQDA